MQRISYHRQFNIFFLHVSPFNCTGFNEIIIARDTGIVDQEADRTVGSFRFVKNVCKVFRLCHIQCDGDRILQFLRECPDSVGAPGRQCDPCCIRGQHFDKSRPKTGRGTRDKCHVPGKVEQFVCSWDCPP